MREKGDIWYHWTLLLVDHTHVFPLQGLAPTSVTDLPLYDIDHLPHPRPTDPLPGGRYSVGEQVWSIQVVRRGSGRG